MSMKLFGPLLGILGAATMKHEIDMDDKEKKKKKEEAERRRRAAKKMKEEESKKEPLRDLASKPKRK